MKGPSGLGEIEFNTSLGLAIREAREARGLTQAELADAAQLSRQSISNIERGQQGQDALTFVRICAALKAGPDDLVTAAGVEVSTKARMLDEVRRRDLLYSAAVVAAREKLEQAVWDARQAGATWDDIGHVLGTSRQSAWARFKVVDL